MASLEQRLARLERELADLRSDLGVVRSLVEQDHGSALNKIRYVTEKVLHQLCSRHDVSWGKAEPTLENMIGPLIAGKIIPKDVAIHVRTVQTNASPGSHYQEAPLGATHVNVAQMALVEFLEWYHRQSSEGSAPIGPASARAAARDSARAALSTDSSRPMVSRKAVTALFGVGALALVGWWRLSANRATPVRPEPAANPSSERGAATHEPATWAPASVKQPEIGLRALDMAKNPKGAQISLLASESFWQSAAEDFDHAAGAPDAPVRWRSGQRFAHGAVHLARGEYEKAVEELKAAAAIEPGWSLPHANLSSALASLGKTDEALEEARTAERLEPSWPGAIAAAARVQARAGKLDAAIQEFRRALAAAPDDAVLLGDLALAYHAARLDPEAERYAKQALDRDGDLVEVRIMLAERALERGQADEAQAEAARAVGVEPDNTAALLCQGDALALAGKKPEALAAYRAALAANQKRGRQGAPEERLKVVEAAVAKDQLPPPRSAPPGSSPPGRARPAPRSEPDTLKVMF